MRLAFTLRYQMFSGAATRLAPTLGEAVLACNEIREAGGRITDIRGPGDRSYTVAELKLLAEVALANPLRR